MTTYASTTVPGIAPSTTPTPSLRGLAVSGETRFVTDGAAVPIRRVLPSRIATYALVDPFLLLDEYHVPPPRPGGGGGFPPHPHRGFEIVSYILEGTERHTDSAGNTTLVRPGGAQRITTGSGIWHSEESDTGVRGLQLWINLARADKRAAPSYQLAAPEDLHVRRVGDASVRAIAGEGAPLRLITPATYLDVTLPAAGHALLPLPESWQGFVYVLAGDAVFGPQRQALPAGSYAALGAGGPLPIAAGRQGARFVLGAGLPRREPVRWSGPYVD